MVDRKFMSPDEEQQALKEKLEGMGMIPPPPDEETSVPVTKELGLTSEEVEAHEREKAQLKEQCEARRIARENQEKLAAQEDEERRKAADEELKNMPDVPEPPPPNLKAILGQSEPPQTLATAETDPAPPLVNASTQAPREEP